MIAQGRIALMFFMEQFCKYNPVLFIPIQLALTRLPFVIAGTFDPHRFAQKIYRVFYFGFFDNLVVFPLLVTHSLFGPTPSTQYSFLALQFLLPAYRCTCHLEASQSTAHIQSVSVQKHSLGTYRQGRAMRRLLSAFSASGIPL